MHRHRHHLDREEHQETRELVKSAFSLARALGIKTLVVQADEISDRRLVEQVRDDERVIWVARSLANGSRCPSLILPKTSYWPCRMPS
jgi:sugar phosphate isomerase/epimerase